MKKRNKESRAQRTNDSLVIDAINAMKNTGREGIESDILGSYRGTGEDGERPVQDSDDL